MTILQLNLIFNLIWLIIIYSAT